MEPQIKFPAIAISENNSFSVVQASESSCTATGWTRGYFDKLSYFDSSGTLWPVTVATLSRKIGFVDRLLNRRFKVSLEFGVPEKNSVDLAKRLICDLIDSDPDDLYSQFVSHPELKEAVRKAGSAKELINIAENLLAG